MRVVKGGAVAGETLLEEVVLMSAKVGLVKPHDHIVCVQRMGESFVIKIVSVNEEGDGVEIIRPKSLLNLMRVKPPAPPPPPQSCSGAIFLFLVPSPMVNSVTDEAGITY